MVVYSPSSTVLYVTLHEHKNVAFGRLAWCLTGRMGGNVVGASGWRLE